MTYLESLINFTSRPLSHEAVTIYFLIFFIIGSIIWIFALLDVIKREFETQNQKIIWMLVVLLGSSVGAIVYYIYLYAYANTNNNKNREMVK